MNAVMTGIDNANDFLNFDVARIVIFLGAAGTESTRLYRENDCLEERFICIVEGTIDKNIALIESGFGHIYSRLRIACRILFKSEIFDFGCIKILTFAANF